MSNSKIIFLVTGLITLTTHFVLGQGCSDAGFCTINSFKPVHEDSILSFSNQFKVGTFIGQADNHITVYGGYAEYNRSFGSNFSVNAKLTSLAQNGNDISGFGLSDFYLNSNYSVNDRIKLTLGAKIPLMGADSKLNNLSLPMDYQASLGTFDLIFGVGIEIKKWHFVGAIQQPLSQNSNQFFAEDYPASSSLRSFQTTNNFTRNGDILLRVSYPFSLSPKLKLTPSILPIYHLSNDTYTDKFNVAKEIIGSKGLTLNGNIYLDYVLNQKSSLQLNIGMPFIVREARPDGLTRSYIANLEYSIQF